MTVLSFFPENLCEPWNVWENRWNEIQEIRLRVNCPVMIRTQKGEYFLKYNTCNVIYSDKDMENVFRHLCHDSVYAYEEERKSEDGIKMCRSDPGIGRIDHHCDNAYQYADSGTDHKYPESDLYASGSDQPAGEAGESYTTG